MIRKPLVRLVMTLCFFAFAVTVSTFERPIFAQCDKVTDPQIVSTIYGKIKAEKGLAGQISHINVVSVSAAVKFQGWANTKKDYEKIVGFGLNTACVKLVNVNNFAEVPPATGGNLRSVGGCATGTKQCGDVCIPEADTCNIGEFMGMNHPVIPFFLTDEIARLENAFVCSL